MTYELCRLRFTRFQSPICSHTYHLEISKVEQHADAPQVVAEQFFSLL